MQKIYILVGKQPPQQEFDASPEPPDADGSFMVQILDYPPKALVKAMEESRRRNLYAKIAGKEYRVDGLDKKWKFRAVPE